VAVARAGFYDLCTEKSRALIKPFLEQFSTYAHFSDNKNLIWIFFFFLILFSQDFRYPFTKYNPKNQLG